MGKGPAGVRRPPTRPSQGSKIDVNDQMESASVTGAMRRLLALLALGAVGTLAALSISTSLALFSATAGPQTPNTFAAGTVTLLSCYTSSATPCIPAAVPAGASDTCPPAASICEYTIEYTGSLPAWIGVSVSAPGLSSQQFSVKDSAFPGVRYGVGPYPDGAFQVVGGATQTNGFEDTFTIQLATVSRKSSHNSSCHGTDDVESDQSGSCAAADSVTVSAQAVQAENNSSTSPIGPEQWS